MIKDDKGVILLVTLWILAILSLLAIGIGFRRSIELKLAGYQMDSLKAYEIAKAGVVKAVDALERDKKTTVDTLRECGITLEENEAFDEKFRNVKVGAGRFNIACLEDAERKIDINTAPEQVLRALFSKTPDAAKNVLAWRGSASVNIGDYSDKPYASKGASFDTINELLLVKDFTPETFSGDENASGIKDIITVYPKPKSKEDNAFTVNVNTASEEVLGILMDAAGFDRTVSKAIADSRTQDNKVFNKPDEVITFVKSFLPTAEGGGIIPDDQSKLDALQKWVSCSSNYFIIRSTGTLEYRKSNINRTITCIVKREISNAPPHKTEIIGWFEE